MMRKPHDGRRRAAEGLVARRRWIEWTLVRLAALSGGVFAGAASAQSAAAVAPEVEAAAGRPPPPPPPPPNVALLGYPDGQHPGGLAATFHDARPAAQAWGLAALQALGDLPWFRDGPNNTNSWEELQDYCAPIYVASLRLMVHAFSSGHAAPSVTAPIAYDLNSLSVRWLSTPPPSDALSAVKAAPDGQQATVANCRAVYPAEQFDPDWFDWQGGYTAWPGGFSAPGEVYPEGTHTRSFGVWVPGPAFGNVNGALVQCSEPTGTCNTSEGRGGAHFFDLDTSRFVRAQNRRLRTGGNSGGACWSQTIQRVVCIGTNSSTQSHAVIETLDPGTRAWSSVTRHAGVATLADGCCLVEHPPSGLILMFTGVDRRDAITLAPTQFRIAALPAELCLPGQSAADLSVPWTRLSVNGKSWPTHTFEGVSGITRGIGFTYVPNRNAYYAVNGVNGALTIWKLRPPVGATTRAQHLSGTWVLATEAVSPGIPVRGSNGGNNHAFIYTGLAYDATLDSLVLLSGNIHDRPIAIKPL